MKSQLSYKQAQHTQLTVFGKKNVSKPPLISQIQPCIKTLRTTFNSHKTWRVYIYMVWSESNLIWMLIKTWFIFYFFCSSHFSTIKYALTLFKYAQIQILTRTLKAQINWEIWFGYTDLCTYLVFISVPVVQQTGRYEEEVVLVTSCAVVPAAVGANFGLAPWQTHWPLTSWTDKKTMQQ